MSDFSSARTEKLRSLSIDPGRKGKGGGASSSKGGAFVWAAVGLALGAAGMYFFNRNAQGAPEVRVEAARVVQAGGETEAAEQQASAEEAILISSGYITPRHRISLSPQVMGKVSWVGVEKGDLVKQDQVLVKLEDEEYQAQVQESRARRDQAQAQFDEMDRGSRPEEISRAKAELTRAQAQVEIARKNLERARSLVEQKIDAPQLLDDAKSSFDVADSARKSAQESLAMMEEGPRKEMVAAAKASLAAAQARLDYTMAQLEDTVIKAPSGGTILEKLIEVGELVSPQSFGGTRGARTELLSLADLGDLQVEVDINESDIAKIRMDQAAKITTDAYPDRSYKGRVQEISPSADRAKKSVLVKVKILEPDRFVLPEMSARVEFLGGTVPAGAQDGEAAVQSGDAVATATAVVAITKAAGSPATETNAAEGKPAEGKSKVFASGAAVVSQSSGDAVFIYREGRAVLRPVKLGPAKMRSGDREVTDGLVGGEPLIVTNAAALADGMKVRLAAGAK